MAQLIVTIPKGQSGLRREVERGVEEYADVRAAPGYADAETVKLALDLVAQGVAIAGGVAGILSFLRSLQQEKRQQGHAITITVGVSGRSPLPVEEADAALLARLLETNPPA